MSNPFAPGQFALPFRKHPGVAISLTAYAESLGLTGDAESHSSCGEDADSIQKHEPTASMGHRMCGKEIVTSTPELSSATTALGQPTGSHREDLYRSSQESNSQRSMPYEPFWSMIRRREHDKSPKLMQSPPNRQVSPKRQQEKLQVLRQRIYHEQSQLQATKQQIDEQRRLHELYIDEQRDILNQEMQQVEKRRESLIIKQMLLERNCAAHSKRNRQANRYRVELFCYKLTHALKLRERETTMKYHFLHLLACNTQRTSQQLEQRPSKILQKVKSCDAINSRKSVSPRAIGLPGGGSSKLQPTRSKLVLRKETKGELIRQHKQARNRSTEHIKKPTQHAQHAQHAQPVKKKKQFKVTRSSIQDPTKSAARQTRH